jgi:FKBP-type peptidyl-prolyl cis-trans isomerase
MKITFRLLVFALLLAGCHQYEKTKTGLVYKIIHGNSKVLLKQGDIVKFNIEYKMKVHGKDSILQSTFGHISAYVKIDTAQFGKHSFTEVLMQCAPGDKIDFVMSIDTLKNLGMIPEYNDLFKKGGTIDGRVDILKVFPIDAAVNADYENEMNEEKNREIKDLQAYAAKNNIKTVQSPNGVLVEVQKEGEGPKADSGMQVSVYFKGYTENGKEFDGNMDSAAKKPAFTFVVGKRNVIPVWDDGLRYFAKGGKGRLLIPAMLGYGPQGSPPVIPPYTNLVFDIEVSDVTTPAPPKNPTPLMPPGAVKPAK